MKSRIKLVITSILVVLLLASCNNTEKAPVDENIAKQNVSEFSIIDKNINANGFKTIIDRDSKFAGLDSYISSDFKALPVEGGYELDKTEKLSYTDSNSDNILDIQIKYIGNTTEIEEISINIKNDTPESNLEETALKVLGAVVNDKVLEQIESLEYNGNGIKVKSDTDETITATKTKEQGKITYYLGIEQSSKDETTDIVWISDLGVDVYDGFLYQSGCSINSVVETITNIVGMNSIMSVDKVSSTRQITKDGETGETDIKILAESDTLDGKFKIDITDIITGDMYNNTKGRRYEIDTYSFETRTDLYYFIEDIINGLTMGNVELQNYLNDSEVSINVPGTTYKLIINNMDIDNRYAAAIILHNLGIDDNTENIMEAANE